MQSLKYFVVRTEKITVSRCESLDLRLFFLPQTVPDSVEIREVYSAEIVSNLQKGSGKKTRLKSVLLKYCTEKDTQQDKGRHTRGD